MDKPVTGRQERVDEGGLALGVGVPVVAEAGGQGPLQVRVGGGRHRVGAEAVAEGQVAG